MLNVFNMFSTQEQLLSGSCGDRILQPLKCESNHELCGDWSITMDYVITEKDDAWKFLEPRSIIRTSDGQLFPTYTMQKKVNSAGVPILSVKAKHIFYYLADKIIKDEIDQTDLCYWNINRVFLNSYWGRGTGLVDYDFTFDSNLSDDDNRRPIKFMGVSVLYALMGAAESIVNVHDGELYRDNFYFSINDKIQGIQEDAFNLIHGFNLSEITETVDYSERITEVLAEDNFGNEFGVSIIPGSFPHQVIRYLKLSYSDEDEDRFHRDVLDYKDKYVNPVITYEVNFVDLRKTNKARDWQDIERLKVGDTGWVYSEMLGIRTKQRIIQIKRDEITGRVLSMKLGNFKHNSLHDDRYDRIIQNDGSDSRRLDVVEAKTAIIEAIGGAP